MTDQSNCIFCDIVAGKAKAYKIYEDDLSMYRRAWQAFDAQLDGRQACRDAVALLDIAARGDCVDVLARRIDEALDRGRLPDVDALRDEFLPTARSQRDVTIPPPDLHSYNSLIASGEVY